MSTARAEDSGRESGGISRRRVLAGAAWTAPAILIASAAPAIAASLPVPGAIALTGALASMVDTQLRVSGAVAYSGNGDAIDDYPVTEVLIVVRVVTRRLTANPSVLLTPLWEEFDRQPFRQFTDVTFRWLGDPLTSSNPLTLPLEAYLSKSGSLAPLTATFTASGVSSGVPVSTAPQAVAVVLGAELALNANKPVGYQKNYNDGTGQKIEVYAFDATTLWAGPYFAITPQVTGVTVTARVPEALSTGRLLGDTIGPDWTLLTTPTVVEGYWQAQAQYSRSLGPLWQNTSTLRFVFEVNGEPQEFVAGLRTAGVCVGQTAVDQASGPSNVLVSDVWDDSVFVGGEIKTPTP